MLTFQGILFGTFAVVLVGNFPKMTQNIFLLNPLMTNAKSCTDWAEIFSVLPLFISKISYFML
jgi:hypothetical protein